ncbi:phospholipase-like protein [Tanacetum coccineum]
MERYDQTFKCTCERGDVVLRTSRKPYSYGKQYYACPCSKPGTQDRGCGYFMWMDDLRLHISSSSGSSTPPSYSPGTSTRPSYSPGSSRSAQNLGKAECSNCKFLAEKIKTLEAKIKILEGALEMERHPEKHTLDSAAILHELYNEMGKLSMENGLLWKTNDESGTPRSRSGWKTYCASRVEDSSNINQCVVDGDLRFILKKTNDESRTPRSQSRWKTSWAKKDDNEDQCASRVEDSSNTNQCAVDGDLRFILKSGTPHSQYGWKTSWAKKDDKKDRCASREEDSSNTNQWGKKEAGSSPLSSGCCGKLMMRVGPLVLSLDGKLLGPKRMTKKINVHPEWKILQTLTNEAKRKLDHLLLHLVKINMCAVDVARSSLDFSNTNQWGKKEAGSSPSSSGKWAAINVHPEWKILQTLTNRAKRKLDHLLLHLVNGLLWKTNDESGTPRSQSGWKTSWAKKDDKEDQCASRVEDSSNTNQWGKKEAGSSPPSSGKWAAVEN